MIILFAQQGRKGGGGGEEMAGVISMLVGCCCWALVFGLMAGFMYWYLVTVYRAFSAVSTRNRDMQPGQIFMVFIPLFGAIWHFFVILRLASSLEKEFESRDLEGDGGDFGKTLGLWGMILNIIGCGPVGLILMIMYILKIKSYTEMLTRSKRGRSSRDEEDDEE